MSLWVAFPPPRHFYPKLSHKPDRLCDTDLWLGSLFAHTLTCGARSGDLASLLKSLWWSEESAFPAIMCVSWLSQSSAQRGFGDFIRWLTFPNKIKVFLFMGDLTKKNPHYESRTTSSGSFSALLLGARKSIKINLYSARWTNIFYGSSSSSFGADRRRRGSQAKTCWQASITHSFVDDEGGCRDDSVSQWV